MSFYDCGSLCGVTGAEGAPLEHARIVCTGREVGVSAVRSSDPSVFSGPGCLAWLSDSGAALQHLVWRTPAVFLSAVTLWASFWAENLFPC